MSDYDPRRPSGSGPEPMDPSAGAPCHLQGPASYPADGAPSFLTEPYPSQPSATGPYPGPYPDQYSGPTPSQYAGSYLGQVAGSSPDDQYGSAYPAPAYSAYPQPGWSGSYPQPHPGWGGPQRPGQVTGAAVLGYVEAGLLMISALFVFAGASIVNDTANALNAGDGGITAQFVLAGMANLIAAALFIAGGAMFTGANPTGRVLLVAAITLTAVTALFWVIRFHDGGIVVWAIAFLTMPAIAACLSFGRSVNAWLQLPRPR